jgi:GMP synthase-like glutamine amidotransferase
MYNKDPGCQVQAERSALYLFDVSTGLNVFPPGIILSGSPYSVYDNVSPHVDLAVFDLGVPILGICYGLQV